MSAMQAGTGRGAKSAIGWQTVNGICRTLSPTKPGRTLGDVTTLMLSPPSTSATKTQTRCDWRRATPNGRRPTKTSAAQRQQSAKLPGLGLRQHGLTCGPLARFTPRPCASKKKPASESTLTTLSRCKANWCAGFMFRRTCKFLMARRTKASATGGGLTCPDRIARAQAQGQMFAPESAALPTQQAMEL